MAQFCPRRMCAHPASSRPFVLSGQRDLALAAHCHWLCWGSIYSLPEKRHSQVPNRQITLSLKATDQARTRVSMGRSTALCRVIGDWVSSSESLQPIFNKTEECLSSCVSLVSRVVPPPHTPTVDAMQRSGDGRCLAHASLSLCVFCVWQLLSHIEKAGSVPGPNSAGWGHSLLKVSDSSRGPPRRLV